MTQVFISYKSEERARVAELVDGLRKIGVEVWWDKDLPPGKDWQERVDLAVQNARLIVVVWTNASVKSKFVRAEAQMGFDEDKLLPVRLENVRIPVPFNLVQTTDLNSTPLTQDENWSRLADYIKDHLIASHNASIAEEAASSGNDERAKVPSQVFWPSVFTALGCIVYMIALLVDSFARELPYAGYLHTGLIALATLMFVMGFMSSMLGSRRPQRTA